MHEESLFPEIVFVADMVSPKKGSGSQYQMTHNMLVGFKRIALKVIFIAIVNDKSHIEDIEEIYSKICDQVICIDSITKFRKTRALIKLHMLYATFLKHIKIGDEIRKKIGKDAILISHSPSIDSALVCNEIKKENTGYKYIQYWSDPLSLALITPEEFYKFYRFKRFIQFIIERKLHIYPDEVVYGTKSLYLGQIKLFPEVESKTRFVGVSCSDDGIIPIDQEKHQEGMVFGYFGSYNQEVRNIIPFYNAVSMLNNCRAIICGWGDVTLQPTNNVEIVNRISQNEAQQMENGIDVEVCILNRVGIQIPGKIFYHTNRRKPILVITDGPRRKEIINELAHYDRFVFCENTVESITLAINGIIENSSGLYKTLNSELLPESVCKHVLIG